MPAFHYSVRTRYANVVAASLANPALYYSGSVVQIDGADAHAEQVYPFVCWGATGTTRCGTPRRHHVFTTRATARAIILSPANGYGRSFSRRKCSLGVSLAWYNACEAGIPVSCRMRGMDEGNQ